MKFVIWIGEKEEKSFSTLVKARRYIVNNLRPKDGPIVIYKVLKYGEEYVAGNMKFLKIGWFFYEWEDGTKWLIKKDGTTATRF